MSSIDIVLTGLLAASTLYSIFRGFVKELFSLLALIFGYIIADSVYLQFIEFSSGILKISLPPWAGFLVVFASSWLLVSLLGKFVNGIISISVTLRIVDRISGGVMGLLKGVVLISITLISLSSFSFTDPLIKKSVAVPYITAAFRVITSLSSSDLVKKYEKKFSGVRREVNKKMRNIQKTVTKETLDNISEEDRQKMKKLLTGILKDGAK